MLQLVESYLSNIHFYRGGSRISHGVLTSDAGPFQRKTHEKIKELGPVGGGPPRSANVLILLRNNIFYFTYLSTKY